MPNQNDPNRRRAVFLVDKEDAAVLEAYARKMGFTSSILMREAVFRLAEELRNNKKTTLIQQPKEDDGRPTWNSPVNYPPKTPRKKK